MVIAAASAPLAGRADENRLNLWPLVGYNDGAFDFIWPLGHFRDFGEWRLFPIVCDRNLSCVFPELWFTKTGFAVLPLVTEYDFGSGTLFPVIWWDLEGAGKTHSVFPAYYYHGNDQATTFWACCGLVGFNRRDGKFSDHRFLPLYIWDRGDFYSLPYSRCVDGGSAFFCGLAGYDSNADGDYQSSWLFPIYFHNKAKGEFITPLFGKTEESQWTLPLYYKDKEKFMTLVGGKDGDSDWVVPIYWRDKTTFASFPYWRQLGNDGEIDRAFSIPLLSGYERDNKSGDSLLYLLMGLSGRVWNDETGGASWVFPLFYKDHESFYTLLYGRNPRRSWLFPLYCRDESQFNSPVYSFWEDAKKGTRGFFSLPLLSGASWDTNSCDKTWFTLAGLVGGSSNASGSHKTSWGIPLYFREEGKSFYSIPFGWNGGGSACTNTYFAAGLAGLKSGSKRGGWIFPIFNREKVVSFDKDRARLDSQAIPDDIVFKTVEHCWTNGVGKVEARTNVVASVGVDSRIRGSVLLGSDHDSSIRGHVGSGGGKSGRRRDDKVYELEEHSKQGNRLVFNRESSRTVTYDIASRERLGERSKSETMALCGFFCDSRKRDLASGTSYARTRILWKLWDRDERNGNVTVDAFPGFTYDAKTNGYTKTSFLWRFFRYENDPKNGKKVDALFIPVWR